MPLNLTQLKCALLPLGVALLLTACNTTSPSNNDTGFAQALQSSERSDKDKARDIGRKPEQVMQFFGIAPGMTVLEILSSGGYYTEILSHRVGDKGKVFAQNNEFILNVLDGRFGQEFAERTANNRLANVVHYQKEFGDFDLTQQVDVVTIVLNYHDLYAAVTKDVRMNVLKQIKTALKPGGTLGIIDMETGSDVDKPKLHRIHHQRVRDELTEAGFVLDGEADFLRNTTDDYSKMVFDPSVRGKTDRFVFRFKKPMA